GKQCLVGDIDRVLAGDEEPITYPDALREHARHPAGKYAFNILAFAGGRDGIGTMGDAFAERRAAHAGIGREFLRGEGRIKSQVAATAIGPVDIWIGEVADERP